MAAYRKIDVELQAWLQPDTWPIQDPDGIATYVDDRYHFEIGLQVPHFYPKEICVMLAGREVVVVCQHDARSDHHGTICRSITRTLQLPADVNPYTLSATMQPHGVLIIRGDKLAMLSI